MGLRLSVRRQPWLRAVEAVAEAMPGLVPVVKGNGYGFGRPTLMPIAARLSNQIAIGTVYEAADVPADRVALVLTPHLDPIPAGLPATTVLTVANAAHISALQRVGWSGPVVVKLLSGMRRYGFDPAALETVVDRATDAGLEVAGYSIHLDRAGSAADHIAEIQRWIPHLAPALPLSVSHLDATTYAHLRTAHHERQFEIRVGTALWHGDRTLISLTADVVDARVIRSGEPAGYWATPAPANGTVVLVAAGSAHGVGPLDDGRSPFHFARQRLALLESPHMHTSMVFVPDEMDCPSIGERVDVQRPLLSTLVDDLEWIDD